MMMMNRDEDWKTSQKTFSFLNNFKVFWPSFLQLFSILIKSKLCTELNLI